MQIPPKPPGLCILWAGKITKDGYGYGYNPMIKKTFKAHRRAYEETNGAIPSGLHIDHLCRVTACVNPDHLEAVSSRVNTLRGVGPIAVANRRGSCQKGHLYIKDS